MKEHKKVERFMLFSEVAQQLSFSRAAEVLGISRGYLSEQIKQLEVEMGSPLLIRSTRNVMLTPEGEQLLLGMDDIKSALLELERNIQYERNALGGTLRITAPELFARRFLTDICHAFCLEHPAIRVEIDTSYTSYDLMQSNFDLAFRATNTPPHNMVAKALLPYRHTYCASPDYLKKQGTPKKPGELISHQCLCGPKQKRWEFRNETVEVTSLLTLNDNSMLKDAALRGYGIIRFPDYVTDAEVEAGQLVRILESEYATGQTIYIIHPQLVHQSARVKAFIAFTQKWFANY